MCVCQVVCTAWKGCSAGPVLCGSSQDVSGDPAFVFYSALCWVSFFFTFKWLSALSSVRSHSPRTKVSLALLLSPHHSSNFQFPQCFCKSGAAAVCRGCVVMDVPCGREQGQGIPGQAGIQLAGLHRGLADFHVENAHISPSTLLLFICSSRVWSGLGYTWEVQLAFSLIVFGFPGSSNRAMGFFFLVFQPHSIPKKRGCLGKLWCVRHQPLQQGSCVSTFQQSVEWEAFLELSVTSFAGSQLPLIAINTCTCSGCLSACSTLIYTCFNDTIMF